MWCNDVLRSVKRSGAVRHTAKLIFISLTFFVLLSSFGCGGNGDGKGGQAGGGNGQAGEGTANLSPEAKAALEEIYKIDPENDTVDDIIEFYGRARGKLAEKERKKQLTPEEKYIYFLTDTLWAFHKLIKLANLVASAVIQGNFDQNTILQIIENLPSAPNSPYNHIEQVQPKIATLQQDSKISSLPYDCNNISGFSAALCAAVSGALLDRIEKNIKRLREIQQEGKDFRIYIKSLPIKIKLIIISYTLDFGGEHDLGLTYFFDSILSFIDSIFRFLFSVSVNIGGALDIPKYLEGTTISQDPILHGGRIATYLLIKNPDLLDVSSEVEVQRARFQLSETMRKTISFIDYVLQNNVDTENDIIYLSSGEDELRMRYKYEGEERDVAILKRSDVETFREKINKILQNLEGKGGKISLSQDFFYVASVMLVGVIKSGVFDAILDVIINLVGGQNEQIQTLKQLMSSDLFQPTAVSGLLGGIFGDVFYFDLGLMFSNLEKRETKLRRWLPAWTTIYPTDRGVTDVKKKFRNNFVVEWDCGAKLYSEDITSPEYKREEFFGLSCTSPQPEADMSHFSEELTSYKISIQVERIPNWQVGQWEIPQDGAFFNFPYILWQDPSFGGLLWIKKEGIISLSGEKVESVRQFLDSCNVQEGIQKYDVNRQAGNCALNMAVQLIIDKLLGVAGGG